MRDDEFQNELRPARRADLCCEWRQRLARDLFDQIALAEWPVDDHRHAALARERQDATLRFAVEDVVAELHEIERMRAHDLLEVTVAAAFRGRDADVAHLAGGLHGGE